MFNNRDINTPFKLHLIPILKDNYVFALQHNSHCILVDPGDFQPIQTWLTTHKLEPSAILLTHHHNDHIGGVIELCKTYPLLKVYGPGTIPAVHQALQHGDSIELLGNQFDVLALPGHTLDHLAYFCKPWLFSGDVIFGMGCGRLFEGSFEQMFNSLQSVKHFLNKTKLNQPTKDILICCTHEYTLNNIAWAKQALGLNHSELLAYETKIQTLRQQGLPSVPLSWHEQCELNPFLNLEAQVIQDSLSLLGLLPSNRQHNPLDIFTALRTLRNKY